MPDMTIDASKELSAEEYDKLSESEREAYDKARKEKEHAEQASPCEGVLVPSVPVVNVCNVVHYVGLPYTWKQTLQDVDVIVQLPKGTKGRDLAVDITKRRLKAGLKGKEPIMEGELCKDIKVDDSTWLLGWCIAMYFGPHRSLSYLSIAADNGELHIHLEKVNQMEWWKNVLTHHPAIDTTKITPENSKLGDLDGETRAMVEKMMVR